MIAACITTYNEAESITSLVRALHDYWWKVYVIDDGSQDKTASLAILAGADVVVQTHGGLGIGPSLMIGWELALQHGATKIVQIDAGGSHNPADAVRLLEGTEHADLVIGSRFMDGSSYFPKTRRYRLSRLATALCNYVHSSSFSDWTSGYRAFSAQVAQRLLEKDYTAKMHGWQIETLGYASSMGFQIAEEPISYIPGESSFSPAVAVEAFGAWYNLLANIGWSGSQIG